MVCMQYGVPTRLQDVLARTACAWPGFVFIVTFSADGVAIWQSIYGADLSVWRSRNG
jgi:hypothetical protein